MLEKVITEQLEEKVKEGRKKCQDLTDEEKQQVKGILE